MEDIPVPGASEALDRPRLRSTGKPAGHTTSVRLAWGRGNSGTFRQLPQLSPRPSRSDSSSRMVVITVAVPQALQGDSFGSLSPAEVVVDDVRVTNKLVHGWRWRLEAVVVDHDLYGGEPGTRTAIIRSRRITGLTPDVIAELIFETGPLPQERHQATPALRPRRRAVGAGRDTSRSSSTARWPFSSTPVATLIRLWHGLPHAADRCPAIRFSSARTPKAGPGAAMVSSVAADDEVVGGCT